MYGTVDPIPRRPRWGSLYALAGALLALFGVVDAFAPAGAWRRTIEVAVTVALFGALHLWVRANRRGLDVAGVRDGGFRTVVIPSDAERPRSEQDIEVTVSHSHDSKSVATHHGRRGGHRWTSSTSA